MKIGKYFPDKIEAKWQQKWRKAGIYDFKPASPKDKYYNLVELPYPSGDLHLGHWFAFVPPDTHARYKKMNGKNVFFPNGFDAFGLPAENAAIKNNIHPKDWTMKNIQTMREQFETMGTMIDWSHSVITCLPEFYKWNQWIFLKMFEKGLAYRGKALSNWCPVDQTVLANEHIEAGCCWRCGAEVVQKEVEQWFLKITDYADDLIWPQNPNVEWPKQVREGQNNWIGRSDGLLINFGGIKVFTSRPDTIYGATFLVIAPEHPFAQEIGSKEVQAYVEQASKKTQMQRKEDKVKSGVFTGKYVKNPVTDEDIPVWVSDYVLADYGSGAIMAVPAHDEKDFEFAKIHNLPIKEVIIPKVIDKHDPPRKGVKTVFRRAIQVILINPKDGKVLALRWKKFPWTTFITGGVEEGEDIIEAAKREIAEEVGYEDVEYVKTLGGPVESHFYANHKKENRKALFSGLVFHIKSEKQNNISKEEVSIHESVWMSWEELNKDKNIKCSEYEIWLKRLFDKPSVFVDYGVLINSGKYDGLTSEEAKNKLTSWFEIENIGKKRVSYHLRNWSVSRQRYWGTPVPIIHCEKCGIVPVSYEDLPIELPYDVDYTPKGKPPLATDENWLKVKCPKCKGDAKRDAETLDTFFDSSWYYYRYCSPDYEKGPFDALKIKELMPIDIYFGGSEHTLGHTLYARFFTKFFKDLGFVSFDEFAQKRVQHGVILGPDGNRMSKSRGNVVSPDSVVKEYGADTVRLYLCFMMPYESTAPWSTTAISGVYRFLKRVWDLHDKIIDDKSSIRQAQDLRNFKSEILSAEDLFQMHTAIKIVGDDLETLQFNTAVSALMIWVNYLTGKNNISKIEYEALLKLLAPFAPHISQELWQLINPTANFIHLEDWPLYQSNFLISKNSTIVIQINGKFRDSIIIENSKIKNQNYIENEAKKSKKLTNQINSEIKRVIYIEGKIINFVI